MNYKRWIIAGVAAAMIGGAAFAYAASLPGLGTSHLGANDVTVSGCNSPITVTYQDQWIGPGTPGGASGFEVYAVVLTVGVGPNATGTCVGGSASVELTGAGGVGLAGGGPETLVSGANTPINLGATAPNTGLPDPTNVVDVSVVVSGP